MMEDVKAVKQLLHKIASTPADKNRIASALRDIRDDADILLEQATAEADRERLQQVRAGQLQTA